MKKTFTAALLLIAVFFISTGMGVAQQKEASPTSPISPSQRESVKLSAKTSAPIATVAPSPEFKRLPQYDFLPKRLRGK